MIGNLDCDVAFCAYPGFQGLERKVYKHHIGAIAQKRQTGGCDSHACRMSMNIFKVD